MKNLYRLKTYMVRYQMHHAGLKVWWVAEQAGVHKTTLRRWLSGRIVHLTQMHLEKLAESLGVPWQEIGTAISEESGMSESVTAPVVQACQKTSFESCKAQTA